MKIYKLELENFRCFEKFEITFSGDYNIHVIIAENMVGKSALMQALKLTANTYTSVLIAEPQIVQKDHRVIGNNPIADIAADVCIRAEAWITTVENEKILSTWEKYKTKPVGERTKVEILSGADPRKQGKAVYTSSQQGNGPMLPLFNFIGTEYIHVESSDTVDWEINGKSIEAYKGCFADKSIKKYLFKWLKKIDGVVLESRHKNIVREAYQNIPGKALQIFQTAVKSIIPDVTDIEWSIDANQPIVKLQNGDIRMFDMLSDGYRYLILLAGELATRSFLLNKQHENILQNIYGVVLIDEFGIHLHPSLQNDSLMRLKETFPNVQFIISTHSPLILNGLKKEQVHILTLEKGKHQVSNPDEDIIGMGADQIITKIFGLPTTLDKEYLDLNEEYKRLFAKKQEDTLSGNETERFKELSKTLAQYRLDPEHQVGEDDTITAKVKEELNNQDVNKLTDQEAGDLDKKVSNIINKLFKKKG